MSDGTATFGQIMDRLLASGTLAGKAMWAAIWTVVMVVASVVVLLALAVAAVVGFWLREVAGVVGLVAWGILLAFGLMLLFAVLDGPPRSPR